MTSFILNYSPENIPEDLLNLPEIVESSRVIEEVSFLRSFLSFTLITH